MRIASFNVNSIRARLHAVLEWLERSDVDVVLLQEIKCVDADFPYEDFTQRGFEIFVHGQKSYNGVATLSKKPARLVRKTLWQQDDAQKDELTRQALTRLEQTRLEQTRLEQARLIEVEIGGVHILNLYVPNGNPIQDQEGASEKFRYKLAWMQQLHRDVEAGLDAGKPMILGGDFNICREKMDSYAWEKLRQDALFHPASLRLFHRLLGLGMVDIWRALHPEGIGYTYWDLWKGRWQKDEGLRIDYFLLSPDMAGYVKKCAVDKSPRGAEKPSDHTPIILEMDGAAFTQKMTQPVIMS